MKNGGRTALAALLFTAACGGTGSSSSLGPPTGKNGRLVRSVCDGSRALLLEQLQLTCNDETPQSPVGRDPRWWDGETPCSRTTFGRDGMTIFDRIEYDYSKPPPADAGSTYDSDGNITAFDASIFLPGTGAQIVFEYTSDHLLHSVQLGAGIMPQSTTYVFEYEDGVRVSESRDGVKVWHYVYDDERRLIAHGPPLASGEPPSRYDENMLEADETGRLPIAPSIELGPMPRAGLIASIAHTTYFYNAEDRIRLIGIAPAPGLEMSRADYSYEGGRLVSVAVTANGVSDPVRATRRVEFEYDCSR